METALAWVEATGVAGAVRDSLGLTASLSAIHLLGVTLVGGGALVAGLRYGGVIFADQALAAVARPAGRAILLGVIISVGTGVLLVSPRASASAANGFFQLKMLCLVGAAVCDVFVRRRGYGVPGRFATPAGLMRSVLYGAVLVAGCAFILLE
jgi:hypothetical protein